MKALDTRIAGGNGGPHFKEQHETSITHRRLLYFRFTRSRGRSKHRCAQKRHDPNSTVNALKMLREGQNIFRYDTFGDEAFWGGQLRLHETIATLAPVMRWRLD
jgi:hypothetical protein